MTMAAGIAGAGGRETTNLRLAICWFETAEPKGPAFGDPENTTWGAFTDVFSWRREGEKDGPNFIPSRFRLEADGRQVRRLKRNLLARTAIALDIETTGTTGEVPPTLGEAMARAHALGFAALGYTSHNHRLENIRYRLVFPMSAEIALEIPAPEIIAQRLGLRGALDESKIGAASLFYLPSCPYGALDLHQTIVIHGEPIDAASITEAGRVILAARQAEADRIAAEGQIEAAARREAKIAAGFNPEDSLIEQLRSRFDLDSVLRSHDYDKAGTKYRHPNSASGSFGADIKVLGGIERVFSHNGNDPLHANNLPTWCGGVTALDAFDVVTILDFGGDRTMALRELAERFNLTKAAEKRAVARVIFRLIREQASQEEIELAAFAEGERRGLSCDEVRNVALWVCQEAISPRAA